MIKILWNTEERIISAPQDCSANDIFYLHYSFLIIFFRSGMKSLAAAFNRRRNWAIHITIVMAAINSVLCPTTDTKHLTSVKLKYKKKKI